MNNINKIFISTRLQTSIMATAKADDYSGLVKYLSQLTKRIEEMEDLSKTCMNEANQQQRFLDNSNHKIRTDMAELRKRVDQEKAKLEEQKDMIKKFITDFRGSASKERLERLRETVDEKNYEQMISREEFKKMIERIKEEKGESED
jgi:hypothetical protein